MKNTLIISGHPKLARSTANRLILEQLIGRPNISVSDIRTIYPDGIIDVPTEQAQLQDASNIVLQFPFIWYGMPAHFRAWMEAVFSDGFAYGRGGDALKNKQVLLSVTLGGSRQAYSANGQHHYPVETFLRPLQMFVTYCGMTYLPPVYSYAMNGNPDEDGTIEEKAVKHAQRILTIAEAGIRP